jgi:hypothetical protein
MRYTHSVKILQSDLIAMKLIFCSQTLDSSKTQHKRLAESKPKWWTIKSPSSVRWVIDFCFITICFGFLNERNQNRRTPSFSYFQNLKENRSFLIRKIIGEESMVMVVKEVIWFQTFETHGCISKTYYLRLVVMKPTNHIDNHGGVCSCFSWPPKHYTVF